ncbi:tRNA-uridine aminocarboxypropyltransferase 1-like [Asterias amurensis]|uniref:tRNA-uridine aminocarboxypropyltransferase 1-like n=1 Tax=Asterias amurensis TaxID=7602 RepID=UPI003AB5C241
MNVKGASPFDGMLIDPHGPLDKVTTRTNCPECGSSRKYFCYTCYLPMPGVTGVYNTVELPLMVDIIKHPAEVDGKSTAVHARLLAPDHVTIYTYPNIPHFENKEKVLLVFPCKDAVSLEDLSKSRTPQNGNLAKEGASSQSNIPKKHPPSNAGSPISNRKATNKSRHSVTTSNADSTDDTYSGDKVPKAQETDTSTIQQRTCKSQSPASAEKTIQSNCLSQAEEDPLPSSRDLPSSRGLSEDLSNLLQISEKDNKDPDVISTGVQIPPIEGKEGVSAYDRVIFIDSTWNQFGVIIRDERLAEFKRVILTSRTTTFWRTQLKKPDTYLATIEAIYYFLVDYHKIMLQRPYSGQYDNLLFFYSFLHGLVKKAEQLKEPKKRRVQKKR